MTNDEKNKLLIDACKMAMSALGASHIAPEPSVIPPPTTFAKAVTNRGTDAHSILQKLKEKHNHYNASTLAPTLEDVLEEIANEVASAEGKWPPMNSAHEAYAVLLEEVDELWEHVKTNQKKRNLDEMRAEAIQVAAMAVRFVRDVSDGGRGRK
jgi:hypothetical protein